MGWADHVRAPLAALRVVALVGGGDCHKAAKEDQRARRRRLRQRPPLDGKRARGEGVLRPSVSRACLRCSRPRPDQDSLAAGSAFCAPGRGGRGAAAARERAGQRSGSSSEVLLSMIGPLLLLTLLLRARARHHESQSIAIDGLVTTTARQQRERAREERAGATLFFCCCSLRPLSLSLPSWSRTGRRERPAATHYHRSRGIGRGRAARGARSARARRRARERGNGGSLCCAPARPAERGARHRCVETEHRSGVVVPSRKGETKRLERGMGRGIQRVRVLHWREGRGEGEDGKTGEFLFLFETPRATTAAPPQRHARPLEVALARGAKRSQESWGADPAEGGSGARARDETHSAAAAAGESETSWRGAVSCVRALACHSQHRRTRAEWYTSCALSTSRDRALGVDKATLGETEPTPPPPPAPRLQKRFMGRSDKLLAPTRQSRPEAAR